MPRTTVADGPLQSTLDRSVDLFRFNQLPVEEVRNAIWRTEWVFEDRYAHIEYIAFERRRRQIRDGDFDVDVDFEPDGSCSGAGYVFPTNGGPEEAVANAGYDTADPLVSEAIESGAHHAEDLGSDAAPAGSPWGEREHESAYRSLQAPDHPTHHAPAPWSAHSILVWRPLVSRRGHAPRQGTNVRPRGSRRCTRSSSSSGDDDPGGEPPDIELLPLLGSFAPVLLRGVR